MTTIPNLNIVIQQGDLVRETQNIRNQTLDAAQLSALSRLEEEEKRRRSVSAAEETEKILFNNESRGQKKNKPELKKDEKRKDKESEQSNNPDSTGRLLNTVA